MGDNNRTVANQLLSIFMPYAKKRMDEIVARKGRFVHYTSAENAMKIIQSKKLWMRTYGFLVEAVPIILAAVLVINILYIFGIFNAIANFTAPVVTGLLGLPKEAVTALVVGVLRKDVALGMLAPLALTAKQLVVGSVVLAMFFPCIATFVVFLRELGVVNMLKSAGVMISAALITGGILNLIL